MNNILNTPLKLDRQDLINYLKEGVKVITFCKVNGDTRRMRCTLNSTIITHVSQKEFDASMISEDNNSDIIHVWEMKVGWRSFRVASVLDFIDADYEEETGNVRSR